MSTNESLNLRLQRYLDRLQAGEAEALNELIVSVQDRLLNRARIMLRDFSHLSRWVECDDVYQGAMRRLSEAVAAQAPVSLLHFYRLATQQIRRELIDLARHYFGPEGMATHHHSHDQNNSSSDSVPSGPMPTLDSTDPARLALWTEFHRQAAALPDEERDVFELRWYAGLSNDEVGEILHVSPRTILRRWMAAWDRLRTQLGDQLPGR